MSDLFRKSSLEKLSSPEQLDRAIVITPPSFWAALAGGALIIAGVLVWSVLGRIPVNVETQGIYVSGSGTSGVYSEAQGIVTQICVEEGDQVREGEVIAVIGSGEMSSELERLEKRIAQVQAVTLESAGDESTADTMKLLELKEQLAVTGTESQAAARMLALKKQELTEAKAAAETAKAEAERLKQEFYDAISGNNSAAAQLGYSEAQSAQATCQASYNEVSLQTEKARLAKEQAEALYLECQTAYDKAQEALAQGQTAYEQAKESYDTQCELVSQLSGGDALPEELTAAVEQQEQLKAKAEAALSALGQGEEQLAALKEQLEAARAGLEGASKTLSTAQTALEEQSAALEKAKTDTVNAKNAYTSAVNEAANISKNQTVSNNEYTLALSQYSSKQALADSLEQTVRALEAEAGQTRLQTGIQEEQLRASFTAARDALLSELSAKAESYEEGLEKYQVLAGHDGKVQEVVAQKGLIVGAGTEIARIHTGEEEQKEAVCYMAISTGKKVTPGMEVAIYPTTVNRQEYGHMSGTVREVAGYVTSTTDISKRLGDETLVKSFLANGPVVEVVCTIREDAETVSGYYWSSRKGADVYLAEGTMLEASIITEKKAPITMVIPLLKKMLAGE